MILIQMWKTQIPREMLTISTPEASVENDDFLVGFDWRPFYYILANKLDIFYLCI